jgi:enoyl-CoA hydratase/carnithine racemase
MSLVEVRTHEGWTEVRLNRPERRNALSSELADQLVDGIGRAERHGPGLVLAANGPVFCAGADLKEGISLDSDRSSARIVRALIAARLFVVAAVDAPVYGAGISLLTVCPVVVATAAASLGFPEAKHGFFPVGVAPWVEGSVPRRRLVKLGMTSGSIGANEAYELGLFTELTGTEDFEASIKRWMALVSTDETVAGQAKRYWVSAFQDDGFQQRIGDLESMLADQFGSSPQPSTTGRT